MRALQYLAVAVLAAACSPGEPSSAGVGGGGGRAGAAGNAGGGTKAAGGPTSTGGSLAIGGTAASGGAWANGGIGGGGASGRAVGGNAAGGSSASGGSGAGGATARTGGVTGTDAGRGLGGATGSTGIEGGAGGTSPGDCSITVTSKTASSQMATVGVVEWSTPQKNLSKARVVYTLNNAGSAILNKGGAAPVDLSKANYRTLLLGLKPSSTYTFHVEATLSDASTCKSADATLTTGTLSGAPPITRTASKPTGQAVGFVISSGGVNKSGGSGANQAFIVDADGVVVWTASAPSQSSRARMDYEGNNMWMMALNVGNTGGEMRYVSMDGVTKQSNVSGLSKSHHDFTVLKGGVVATMAWAQSGMDPESDLIERSADGKITAVFHIGSNLYKGGPGLMSSSSTIGYHCNSLLYHESDDTYTIGDRNPSSFVKVNRAGKPVWQFGGDCSSAPAPKCVPGSWSVNHGHHVLDNGNFLFFSNGAYRSTTPSSALEFTMSTSGTMQASQVKSYASSTKSHSDSLGDVQRLPNGNTLIVFSNDGLIEEVDSSWNVVQTLEASSFGYADWRETLYGPPPR